MKLVSRFMGTATSTLLKEEFKRAKLSYGNPREPMSYENWVASVKRMEALREANESMKDDIKFLHKMNSRL